MEVNSIIKIKDNIKDKAESKENIHCHNAHHKVKFNILDAPNKKESSTPKKQKTIKSLNKKDLSKLKTKLSMKSSNNDNKDIKTKLSLRSTNGKSKKSHNKIKSLFNNCNNEAKKKSRKSSKSNYIYQPQNNLLLKNFIKDESDINSNKKNYSRRKSVFEQTKNNFLKLITKENEGNYIREYEGKNSKCSSLFNNNFLKIYEKDSLENVEKKLQSKIIDMEKEECVEFEIGPLDISVNKINKKKTKKKIMNKKTKDFKEKKYEKNKEDIKVDEQSNNMINKAYSSDSKNLRSEGVLTNKSQNFDGSNKNINHIKNKNINLNTNLYDKLKLSSMNLKTTNYKSGKESNILINNNKSSKEKFNNRNSKASLYEKIKSLFKTKETKLDFSQKDTILTKNNIYSNIDSKFGTTLLDKTESFDITKSFISGKDIAVVNKEKFRILEHKKLVYDSLDDDEELIADQVKENFYLAPNSVLVIIVDTMVLILTFWNIVYKPLYLVLNNCDVKNEITSISFYNISNLFVDLLFIFDLIINCFKSYYNFEEQLITKTNRIFVHYLKKYFFVDLISAIPYYSIIKFIALNRFLKYGATIGCSKYYNHKINDRFQILELLKLIKIFKCLSRRNNITTNYILNKLSDYTFFENWSFLIFNTCLFFLLLHLAACIHIFISCTTFPNWIVINNLDFSSFPLIYLNSIYFLLATVTTVGYGDIIGNSVTEYCFQIIILLVGIIAYSWLISSISNYIKEINKENETFDKKICILNEIKLDHPNMSQQLYDKIFLHLEYINFKQKKDKSALLNSLPPTISKSLLCEMYKPIIDNFYFFKKFKNSEFINQVVSKLKPIIAVKNNLLFDQGEIIEETFFVKQGKLSLEVKIDTDYPEKSVQKLLDKEYFFGVENNELYQKNAFGLMNMTSKKHVTHLNSINQKNLYDLYSRNSINMTNINRAEIKTFTNDQSKGEQLKHLNTNTNCIYLKILDIRKNEHFGALLMFLNKRSPFSLRVKTKNAELYLLKKLDAVEISSNYPNIWKRVNKASFHNLKQIKKIMHKIIKHYCETYGINFMKKICKENNIKDMDELKQLYTLQHKISKNYYKHNFSLLQSSIHSANKRFSASMTKSQLKMLKEFINNNEVLELKPFKETHIAHPDIKDLNLENSIHTEKDNNFSMSKKIVSTFREDSHMNSSSNMIKAKNDDNSYKKENILFVEDDKNNSNEKNINENSFSKEYKTQSKNTFKIDEINIYQNKYENEEAKNLIKNYGTPFYPEDVNDEIYSLESPIKVLDNNIENKNESENIINYNQIFSSPNTVKNNNKKRKNYNKNKINSGKRKKIKNVTFNHNLITNYYINNINSLKLQSEYKVFHFGFNFKSKLEEKNYNSKNEKNNNKIYNLAIFQNSFELSAFNNNKKIYLDLNKILKDENKIKFKNKNNSENNKIFRSDWKKDNFSSENNSYSSSSVEKNKIMDNTYTYETPLKKIIHSSSYSYSTIKQNGIMNKEYKIDKNKELKYKSKYFNLNQITNGRIIKNINFQNYIKNIIFEKLNDLTNTRMEFPKIENNIKSFKSNKIMSFPRIKNINKYSIPLPNKNLHFEKIKNSIPKNQRSHLMASELNEQNKGNIYSTKKINRKNMNRSPLLNYINKNIKDDSVVLHDPRKFYNGLFNNIVKKYSKANINIFQK